ncbi:hypothetical protein [Streptomyces violascens]|nr:hypothetical protein [Streptomyces violascens]
MSLPVALAVLTKRAASKSATAPGAGGGGLGELLTQILGGAKK